MGTKNRNESQFDEYRDWQWIKHLILTDYAYLWARILGSAYGDLVAVDVCAGAGTYTHPDTGEEIADGSARILGRAAERYTKERGPGKTMRVICCEKNTKNYNALVRAIGRFEPYVKTLHGDFARHVPTIVEELGNSPALILLDPIGVATIPADVWKPLLDRKAKTDFLIILHFAGVHRVGGWLTPEGEPKAHLETAAQGVATMDRVFNGRGWRDIALDPALTGDAHREEREQRYMQLFFDNVIGNRHRWKCYCPVRARHGGPVKYWLLHASDDPKPYRLMNDEVVKVNKILLEREYRNEGSIDGFLKAELDAQLAHVEAQMAEVTIEHLGDVPGGTLPWSAIEEMLLHRFFGRATANVPWRVVKRLCGNHELVREQRKTAAADPREMIALPVPPGAAEGGTVVPLRRVA